MEKINNLTITKPAGNDTGLVKGLVKRGFKKKINDAVTRKFPNVEQVGFYDYDKKTNTGILEMAGGEFCGNATRSTAYLLLNGKPGEIMIKVSGTKKLLKAGIKEENTAYAQMPIYNEFSKIKKISSDTALIELEGIVHLITKCPSLSNPDSLKLLGKELMETYDLLLPYPAAGVMFLSEVKNTLIMDPIIWVRDIQTLFYETACASGTTAVGLWKALAGKKEEIKMDILQPSGYALTVNIKKNATSFTYAEIEGPIRILEREQEVII